MLVICPGLEVKTYTKSPFGFFIAGAISIHRLPVADDLALVICHIDRVNARLYLFPDGLALEKVKIEQEIGDLSTLAQ